MSITYSISIGSTEDILRQINCKNRFSDQAFYVTIADADIGSLKSLHTLFGKYLDHMLVKFEQNHKVQTIQNFELFDKKKQFNHFWQSVDAILEDASVTETSVETIVFHCSQNYVSPTGVTRLKVAPNMADLISLNETRL